MAYVEWSSTLELGIGNLDEHHKELVKLLNKIYTEFIDGIDMEQIEEMLYELIDYATYHFAAERKWMSDHDYPHLSDHCAEHEAFCRQIDRLKDDFYAGKIDLLPLEVIEYVKNWLFDHIAIKDADLVRFAC